MENQVAASIFQCLTKCSPARRQHHFHWLVVFQRTFVRFLLTQRWAGRTGGVRLLAHYHAALTEDVYLLLFPAAHFSTLKWFLHHAPKGWIWQSKRFHHFPDCAGTVKIRHDSLMRRTGARPSATIATCQTLKKRSLPYLAGCTCSNFLGNDRHRSPWASLQSQSHMAVGNPCSDKGTIEQG